jgi:hypothetical protein
MGDSPTPLNRLALIRNCVACVLFKPEESVRGSSIKATSRFEKGMPSMNEKKVLTEIDERRRRQSSLLSTFEEIAQTFLNSVSGERGNGTVFTWLQEYLDGSVLIDGAYCRRRTIVLTIHDLKEELEAPPTLQSKTLAKLELLHIRPVPQVAFYQDIATAILRMEVVIRLEAMQALAETTPVAAGQTPRRPLIAIERASGSVSETWLSGAPRGTSASRPQGPAGQICEGVSEGRRTASWSTPKLRTIGYGLAAVACYAGTITFLNNWYVGEIRAGASTQLAANQVETLADIKLRARDCIPSSNDDAGKQIKGSVCTLGASPTYNQRKLFVTGNSLNAAEFVMSSVLTEAGLGSVIATPSRVASPVRETPNQSSWATTVEANNLAGPTLLSEVKTQ